MNNILFNLIKQQNTEDALRLIDSLKHESFKKQQKIFNYSNHNNENCLMEASFQGNLEVLKALINFSVVDFYTVNKIGNNVLMLAILNEKIDVIKYLLDVLPLNIILNHNYHYDNIVHLALLTKNEEIINNIIKHFKSNECLKPFSKLNNLYQEKNKKGLTPIELALELNLDIFFKLGDLIRPLFLLKNLDSKSINI